MSVETVGLANAIPPSLAGRARRLRSMSFGGGLPVSAGINLVLITASRGLRQWPRFGIVRVRYDHLLLIPWVNAA